MDSAKRLRAPRKVFAAGSAVNTSHNFYVEWDDLDDLTDELLNRRWLLIKGPWQSGKSSLMLALAQSVESNGLLTVVTTLTEDMVLVANDPGLTDVGASDAFFNELARMIEIDSKGLFTRPEGPSLRGMGKILDIFIARSDGKEVVWFIDEAALLNDITRASVLTAFLSGLRTCKQGCNSRGTFCLRSFVLLGTSKTSRLLSQAREERKSISGADYVVSSPLRKHDTYRPFGNSTSPLSMEADNSSSRWLLREDDIANMLTEYAMEYGVYFRLQQGTENLSLEVRTLAIRKFAGSIYGLTGGYKGMVGCCCDYVWRKSVHTVTQWKRDVRSGLVAAHVFYSKVYSRIVSQVPTYSEELQEIILQCVQTGGPVPVQDPSCVLPAINDGVLAAGEQRGTVTVVSGLLLAAILEDCSLSANEALPEEVESFEEVMRTCFAYINLDRLTRPEVLNSNGQPSEYMWQSEFILGLKFVLEKAYRRCRYVILVEAKRRDKNGTRRTRMDFLLRNAGSPLQGIEVQGEGDEASIVRHISKSEKYRKLHECEMSYVYLRHGDSGMDAKAVIQRESLKYPLVKCWFVAFMPRERKWRVELLQTREDEGSNPRQEWRTVERDAVNSYPKFTFRGRREMPPGLI